MTIFVIKSTQTYTDLIDLYRNAAEGDFSLALESILEDMGAENNEEFCCYDFYILDGDDKHDVTDGKSVHSATFATGLTGYLPQRGRSMNSNKVANIKTKVRRKCLHELETLM